MLNTHFTIAIRTLFREKWMGFVNVLGLTVGFAATIFLIQYVEYELSFDQFHEKRDRVYRLLNDRYQSGERIHHSATSYAAVGHALATDFSGDIELHTRMMAGFDELNVKVGDEILTGGTYLFADSAFLEMFSFKLLAGDRQSSLARPYNIVLSKTQALKYFPDEKDVSQLVGKTIMIGLEQQPYTVSAICEDIPGNSHLVFDALISYSTLIKRFPIADNSWTWTDMRHYFLLKDGVRGEEVQERLPDFSQRHFEGTKRTGSDEIFFLQSLNDIHLYSDLEYDIARTSNGGMVWGLLTAAIVILALAFINYANLSFAQAMKRMKEIGIRKTMGALAKDLSIQFLAESSLVVMSAVLISLALVGVLQTSFNNFIGVDLSLSDLLNGSIMTIVVTLIIMMSVFVALPAFIAARKAPSTALMKYREQGSGRLGRYLTIVQFGASTVLLTSAVIISSQLNFIGTANLGLSIDSVMVIKAPVRSAWDTTFLTRMNGFQLAAMQIPGVIDATSSNKLPGDRLPRIFKVHLKDRPSEDYHTMSTTGVGSDFFRTYDVKLLAGRAFVDTDHKAKWPEIKAVIINESAARALGIAPTDAIGRELFIENRYFELVGVVSDFHQESLKSKKEPMLFRPAFGIGQAVSIKLAASDPVIVEKLKTTFATFFPGNAFDYFYLRDRFDTRYQEDYRFGKAILLFSITAIIVSCIGLIAIASRTATSRTKEIGIRKVLGATVSSVTMLLTLDFVKLVVISIAIAIPVTILLMDSWLSRYAYHVTQQPMDFVITVVSMVVIAVVTVLMQVGRTARINPAKTLKHE